MNLGKQMSVSGLVSPSGKIQMALLLYHNLFYFRSMTFNIKREVGAASCAAAEVGAASCPTAEVSAASCPLLR